MKKECKGYYEKIENFFREMKYNFDDKPLGMLALHACSGFAYLFFYSGIEDDNGSSRILLYSITIIWGISIFLGLVYMIFAIFKKTKKKQKLFALSITTAFTLFFLMWNMFIILWAAAEFYDFTEWIPVLIFEGLSCGWFIYTIIRIRKEIREEIREEPVKPIKISFWLIVFAIGSFAPLATFSGRRNIGSWLPENIFLYYMSYLTFIINAFATRFLLDMIMYCKLTLFGRKNDNRRK